MTPSQKSLFVGGLMLAGLGLGLPRAAFGAASCTNNFLTGTYNAEVSSLSFMDVLSTLNGSAGSPGSTGGSTGAVTSPGGFGNNKLSLSGQTPGSGRYYFDGAGNIWGRQTAGSGVSPLNQVVGSYSVSGDCSATMSLSSGESFNAVVGDSGREVLFLQSNAGTGGAVGALIRSVDVCTAPSLFPQNFAYSVFGAQSASTGGTGSAASVAAWSAIGEVALTDNGTFTLKQWTYSSGRSGSATASGTYSVGSDCGLSLTFASTPDSGAVSFQAPSSFRATLNNVATTGRGSGPGRGALIVQPVNVSTVVGRFVSQ